MVRSAQAWGGRRCAPSGAAGLRASAGSVRRPSEPAGRCGAAPPALVRACGGPPEVLGGRRASSLLLAAGRPAGQVVSHGERPRSPPLRGDRLRFPSRSLPPAKAAPVRPRPRSGPGRRRVAGGCGAQGPRRAALRSGRGRCWAPPARFRGGG